MADDTKENKEQIPTVYIKAFLVVAPGDVYPKKDALFIGGVASSVAHEVAGELGGMAVELTGSYPLSALWSLFEEKIETAEEEIKVSGDPKGVWSKYLESLEKEFTELKGSSLSRFTNDMHLSGKERKAFGG